MLKKYIYLAVIFSFFIFSCSSSEEEEISTPNITIENVSELEGNGGMSTFNVNLNLDAPLNSDLTIGYNTDDGSAFQEVDYIKAAGDITIEAGETQAVLSLDIIADEIREGNEMFRVLFEDNQMVEFNTRTVEVNIGNDDQNLPYDEEDYSTPGDYAGWALEWADEFNGTEINTDWWVHEIGNGDNGWGNNEIQYYTDGEENSRVEDGNLVIEARDDAWNGNQYTSARMITKDKQNFGFSRIDIRARLPYGQGIWPALWMLGINIDDRGWPACGEIDITELVGHQASTSHATLHWGVDPASHDYLGQSYSLTGEKFNDRFHVFSVVREFNRMWFYVDDIMIYEFTPQNLDGQPNPFNEQFFFIFNIAIGGNWPGNPDETTTFPQTMEVDYVRVFTKNVD